MPIINRRKSPATPAPPPAPSPAPAPQPTVAATPQPTPARDDGASGSRGLSRPILYGAAALLLGVAVPFLAYRIIQAIPGSAGEEADTESVESVPAENVELDLEQLYKLAGVSAMIREELEGNKVTRGIAAGTAEPSTLAAFDSFIEKNQRDLAQTQERMAQVLVALHAAFEDSPEQVTRLFESSIADAEKNGLAEVARMLKLGLDSLQQVPAGVAPGTFFKQAITENS